jgi:hypothetical protein
LLTENLSLPCGGGTTIRYNRHTTHHAKEHTALKQNTAHKTMQTREDTLHTVNTMQMHVINITINTIAINKN